MARKTYDQAQDDTDAGFAAYVLAHPGEFHNDLAIYLATAR